MRPLENGLDTPLPFIKNEYVRQPPIEPVKITLMPSLDSHITPPSKKSAFVETLYPLSGKALVNRILEGPDPQKAIRHMASDDLYWLIKRLGGDEDRQMLLALASEQQWQHIMDLELWSKDRLDLPQAYEWLKQLQGAVPERLTRWLFSEGQSLAFYTLFKSIDVWIRDPDDDQDPDPGFVTFDGVHYIRVRQKEHKSAIEGILKGLADEDQLKYQSLLLGLAGVIPAEMEEEMYRTKTVRLAEHGFLPYEEALSIYAPLKPEGLKSHTHSASPSSVDEGNILDLAPFIPLHTAMGQNTLSQVLGLIDAPDGQDRIRLEFAGLCNQLLSADNHLAADMDTLRDTCRKAGGYLNVALENIAGNDISVAEALLRNNPLRDLFRAGFTMTLKLKWKAQRWLKNSWFQKQGVAHDFWPDAWSGTLTGLLKEKPGVYQPGSSEKAYRAFEYAHDIENAEHLLDRLMAVDALFAQLTAKYPLHTAIKTFDPNFPQLLFTLWARKLLNITPLFEPLSSEDMKRFFTHLRRNESDPPFEMIGYEGLFVADVMAEADGLSIEMKSTLEAVLTHLWKDFSEAYRWVQSDAIDARFSPYLLCTRPPATS